MRALLAVAIVVMLAATIARADPPPAEGVASPTPAEVNGALALAVDPPGAEIAIDGNVVGTAPLAADVPLAPGPHRIEIRAADRSAWTRDVVVAAAQRLEIAVALLPAPVAAPPPPAPAPPPAVAPPPSPPAGSVTPLGRGPVFWSGVAATGALVVVGTVTGTLALSQQAEYEDASTSRVRRRDLYDSMNGLATATDVLLDAAIVVGIATALLFVCAGPEEEPRPPTHGPFEWIGAHCF